MRWTEEEIALVRKHYLKLTDAQLGKKLGRSGEAVSKVRSKFKLSKKVAHPNQIAAGVKTERAYNTFSRRALFEVNKKLLRDWYHEHGERGYGDEPVNYGAIINTYSVREAMR